MVVFSMWLSTWIRTCPSEATGETDLFGQLHPWILAGHRPFMEILALQFPRQALVSCWRAHVCWAKWRRVSAKWENKYPFAYWGNQLLPPCSSHPSHQAACWRFLCCGSCPWKTSALGLNNSWHKTLSRVSSAWGRIPIVAKVGMPLSVKSYPKHLAPDIVLFSIALTGFHGKG